MEDLVAVANPVAPLSRAPDELAEFEAGIRLNRFFTQRGAQVQRLGRCPGCDTAARPRPFMMIRGAPGSEGAGVAMPAVRCRACRLVFLNPRLPSEDVAALYRQSARLPAYFTTGYKAALDGDSGFLPFVRFLERRLHAHQRQLFDLGCGTGAFMRLMRGRGFECEGADVSPPVVEIARRDFGDRVFAADAEEAIHRLARAGRRLDVVTMIHTFEHLPSPLRLLERLREILRDDGVVALNVPNVRYFLVSLDRRLGSAVAGIWDPVGHFSYFSLRSLAALCERAGFDVEAKSSRLLVYGRPGILGWLDAATSLVCRTLGGIGSNISIVARAR